MTTKEEQFESAWFNCTEGLQVVPLSANALEKISAIAPESPPQVNGADRSASGSQITLFAHQKAALAAWRDNGRRGLLEMCTGSGKTVAALEAISEIEAEEGGKQGNKGTLAVVLCPTKILVEQWAREILLWRKDWLCLKAYEAIEKYRDTIPAFLDRPDDRCYVIVATYATALSPAFCSLLKRNSSTLGNAIFIADEAHNISTPRSQASLDQVLPLFPYNLALTATPEIETSQERTSNLLNAFGGNVFSYGLQDAIADGILCPYNYYPRPVFLDTEKSIEYMEILKVIEKDPTRMASYQRKRELLRKSGCHLIELERLADEIEGNSEEKFDHTLVFCPPGKSDEGDRILAQVKEIFDRYGILVASITAETPAADRTQTLKRFKAGAVPVLLAIGCLDEGLDIPEIRRSIILYSVDRLKQFVQRRGRVLRRVENKEAAEIYDFIILPQGSELSEASREKLMTREMRRYVEFAAGSLNAEEA